MLKKLSIWLSLGGLLLICSLYIYNTPAKLEVDFLDVGQGDSALIKTPGGQVILIDGGPDNQVLWRLGENLPFYRRQIDLIILSHYHDDHAMGLAEVIKRYHVKKLIYAAGSPSSTPLAEIIKVAYTRSTAISALANQARVNLGGNCFLDLLNAVPLNVKADPNNSLVAKLNCAGEKFLWSGDNSAAVEKVLLNSGWDLAADVLKASHHGSNTASSEDFLRAVQPQLMVISVGAANRFGHPSPLVLQTAARLGISIKRTDQVGNIRVGGR